jgi:hypothetical protein
VKLSALLVALVALLALPASRAQGPAGGGAGGFSMPFKKDGRTYLWFKGSGTEAISASVVRIRDFRVETFREDETPDLVGGLDIKGANIEAAARLGGLNSGSGISHRAWSPAGKNGSLLCCDDMNSLGGNRVSIFSA